MCTSSSDTINSKNMLFLLEAVYIMFQQCLNQDLFVQKGSDDKKQSNVTLGRIVEGSHLCWQQGWVPNSLTTPCCEPAFWEGVSFLVEKRDAGTKAAIRGPTNVKNQAAA